MIHSASREALTELRGRLTAATARFSTTEGLAGLSDELYGVSRVLFGEPRLRRALADPSTEAARRAELAGRLLDGKISASAMQIVRDAVSMRWSAPWDLVDSLELLADEVLFAAADDAGCIDQVEDELFRFERIVADQPQLMVLLDEPLTTTERKVQLLDSVVAAKVHPISRELLKHAVSSHRKHSVTLAIDDLLQAAAQRRDRSVAKVVSAVELTAGQQDRLIAALSELYGRPISVRTSIEPSVRDGLVVRIGDEVIDGSVAARLTQARNAMVG
ncbi:MAG: F0F1 ATP synthase subunit delta [Jatrophihabitantaceae bacterium]